MNYKASLIIISLASFGFGIVTDGLVFSTKKLETNKNSYQATSLAHQQSQIRTAQTTPQKVIMVTEKIMVQTKRKTLLRIKKKTQSII